MSEEIIYHTINEKIEKMGYKSALLRLALLKEGHSWKIYIARIVFDMQKPSDQKTLVKTENFALEDFSLSIDDFHNFLEFLKKSYVGNIVFPSGQPSVSEEHFYKIGDYKLCFIGNFPGRELYFFRREIGIGHGIDRPLYFTDYSIHQSVRLLNYLNVDLTSHEIPFRDALDAINHFWQVKYEAYQASSTSFPFYFPVYDASIVSCSFINNKLIVKVDVDEFIAKRNELSLSVIIEKKPGFRKKFPLDTNTIEIPLSFEPDYATLYLTKNTEKIDEYYYRSDYAIKKEDEILASINNTPGREIYVNEKSLGDLHVEKTVTEIKTVEKIEKLGYNQVFTKHDFDIENDLCFVLMPFQESFKKIYDNHIKPTLEKAGFRVMISSDIFTPTVIIQDIWEYINKANLIVADVTGKNPNVFYELGISHSLGKYVIIITQNGDDVPFDLRHLRYFSYANNDEGMMILSGILDNTVKSFRNSK